MRGARRAITFGAAILITAVGCGGGDDDADRTSTGGAVGGALGAHSASSSTSTPEAVVETTAPEDDTPGSQNTDLPAPDTAVDGTTPTTAPDQEAITYPIGFPPDEPGNSLPLYGDILVDLDPGGYKDFPVHLEQGRQLAVLSGGDDGILTHIEVYRPDGTFEGSWDGGEEGGINGLEWVADDDLVPATGTFVFRCIHTGG